MTKCVSTSHAGTLVALVAAAAMLLLPATASAADPATDQYAPSTPGGGGNVPVTEGDGKDFGGGAAGNSGSGSDGGTGASPAAPAVATAGATDGGATDGGATGSTGGDEPSRVERTLGSLAAQGKAQRDAQAEAASATGASTDLIRSESDEGGGLGPFLWVVLGLTLAWAIAMGVSRRRVGGHPA